MILFLRSLPALLALWLLACFVAALQFTQTFWIMTACATIIPIFGLRLLTRRAALPRRFFSLAMFPALITVGSFGALLFSEHQVFQICIIVGTTLLHWLTYEQAFRFTHQPARYQKNALTNLALLAAIVGFFYLVLVLFDLGLFADLALYYQLALFIFFTSLWYGGVAYLLQADRSMVVVLGSTTLIVGVEVYLLLNRLPPLPAVKAGVLVVIIGASLQLLRRHVEPQEKLGWWTFGVLGLVLFSLLVTAQWFA